MRKIEKTKFDDAKIKSNIMADAHKKITGSVPDGLLINFTWPYKSMKSNKLRVSFCKKEF